MNDGKFNGFKFKKMIRGVNEILFVIIKIWGGEGYTDITFHRISFLGHFFPKLLIFRLFFLPHRNNHLSTIHPFTYIYKPIIHISIYLSLSFYPSLSLDVSLSLSTSICVFSPRTKIKSYTHTNTYKRIENYNHFQFSHVK